MNRSPIRRVSRKRAKLLRQRRKVVEVIARESGGLCSLRIPGICQRVAVDVHELLPRSAGGSITDPANLRPACRACHQHAHRNPIESYVLGLLRRREYAEGGTE